MTLCQIGAGVKLSSNQILYIGNLKFEIDIDSISCERWKLVQLGLDDQYKRLNEVRGKERLPNTQVDHLII